MTKVPTQNRDKSDRLIADDLLREYAEYQKEKKEAAKAEKEIEQQLLELAEKHDEWFEEKKTATFEHGKLKFTAVSKIETPKEFDIKEFAKKFPSLVKVAESLQVAKVRVYLEDDKLKKGIDKFGVEITATDKFKVEVS